MAIFVIGVTFLTRGSDNVNITTIVTCAGLTIALFALIYYLKIRSTTKMLIVVAVMCAITTAAFLMRSYISSKTALVSLVFIMLIVAFAVSLKLAKRLDTKTLVVLMIAAGLVLRTIYIMYTSLEERQHDVGSFSSLLGHSGYIEYLYSNMHLPDFDVRNAWQFYHPPLYHSICALWMAFVRLLGVPLSESYECTQFVNLFCSAALIVLSCKIFMNFNLKGAGLATAVAVVCFYPSFIFMTGTLNNDMMCIMFTMGAFYCALKWYKNQTFFNIIQTALCVGLGMMAKLSGWVIAPSIAVLFLYVLVNKIKSSKKIGRSILQYVVFGIISVPLGVWWQVRNYLCYKVPITYIQSLGGAASMQYVANHSIADRLFNFSSMSVYDHFIFYGDAYDEFNPTLGYVKTSLFGERVNSDLFPQINGFGDALFWVTVVFAIVCIIASIVFILFKNNYLKSRINAVFVGLFVAVMTLSYYIFCFKYPYTCTQNVRYALPLIIMGAMFFGMYVQSAFRRKNKIKFKLAAYGAVGIVSALCILSTYIYSVIT